MTVTVSVSESACLSAYVFVSQYMIEYMISCYVLNLHLLRGRMVTVCVNGHTSSLYERPKFDPY